MPCPCFLSVLLVTLFEAFDAAALGLTAQTARKERVALRANIDAKLFLRGARRELVAAAASHRSLEILGMDSFFHAVHLTFSPNGTRYKRPLRPLGQENASPHSPLSPHRGNSAEEKTALRQFRGHYSTKQNTVQALRGNTERGMKLARKF